MGRDGKGSLSDLLVMCAGRTMGLGQGPDFLNVWWSAGCGLERLDAWDEFSRAYFAYSFASPNQRQPRSGLLAMGIMSQLRSECLLRVPMPVALRQPRLRRYEWESFKDALRDRLCAFGLL